MRSIRHVEEVFEPGEAGYAVMFRPEMEILECSRVRVGR